MTWLLHWEAAHEQKIWKPSYKHMYIKFLIPHYESVPLSEINPNNNLTLTQSPTQKHN